MDMRFDPYHRHLGLRPPERTAQRRKSLSFGGAAIWRHVIGHIGTGGYSPMGSNRVDASKEVAETDAKVYAHSSLFSKAK